MGLGIARDQTRVGKQAVLVVGQTELVLGKKNLSREDENLKEQASQESCQKHSGVDGGGSRPKSMRGR